MILLITGASHTGKTLLAQGLMERLHVPYLSMDHLKMGLIRSGQTALTPCDDEALTEYLWPILREIVKTAVENRQSLILEGCYLPPDWAKDFSEAYLREIRCLCLVMSPAYIRGHLADIRVYASAIEARLEDSDCTLENVLRDNAAYQSAWVQADCKIIGITERYDPGTILETALKLIRDQS